MLNAKGVIWFSRSHDHDASIVACRQAFGRLWRKRVDDSGCARPRLRGRVVWAEQLDMLPRASHPPTIIPSSAARPPAPLTHTRLPSSDLARDTVMSNHAARDTANRRQTHLNIVRDLQHQLSSLWLKVNDIPSLTLATILTQASGQLHGITMLSDVRVSVPGGTSQ